MFFFSIYFIGCSGCENFKNPAGPEIAQEQSTTNDTTNNNFHVSGSSSTTTQNSEAQDSDFHISGKKQ